MQIMSQFFPVTLPLSFVQLSIVFIAHVIVIFVVIVIDIAIVIDTDIAGHSAVVEGMLECSQLFSPSIPPPPPPSPPSPPPPPLLTSLHSPLKWMRK